MPMLGMAEGDDPSPIPEVKAAYAAYIEAFIAGDLERIADCFAYPMTLKTRVLSIIPVSKTLEDRGELIEEFKTIRGDIEEGYSYSKVERIDVSPSSVDGYAADVYFTRYNQADEVIYQGRSIYSFSELNGAWRIFAMMRAERE